MAKWQQVLQQLGNQTDTRFDQLTQSLRQRLQRAESIVIVPYHGFGTHARVQLTGRVLRDQGVVAAQDDDTLWENLHAMYLRFASNEVAGVPIQAAMQGETWETVTDAEGYFTFDLSPARALPSSQTWHEVQLTLLNHATAPSGHPITAVGKVITPTASSTFGVISDIDDTIVATQATNLLKMARIVFLNNARTRLPFEGIAAFYRALQRGVSGTEGNPIFYVSSSPWNLYDLLVDFLAIHGIPLGPLFLQDYGLDAHKFITAGHHTHKVAAFQRILHTYPTLPFVLIGDSGQADPEIYTQIVRDYPGRIRAIYIRDVSDAQRDSAVQKLVVAAKQQDVEMLLVPDTLAAANHAIEHGYIHPEEAVPIDAEKRQDAAAPTDIELLVEAD